MGNLSDIATVNVSTANVGIKRAGFNKILIADYHTRFAERVREYADVDEMIADGFTVNDAAYKAASIAFSQSPQPATIKVGRRALAPDLQVDLFPTAANSTVYSVDIVGPAGLSATVTFTSDASATVAEIVAGLVAAINTAALGVTATDITTNVRIKAASAGLWFSVKVNDLSLLRAMQTHSDPGIATDLAAIALADPEFYGLSLTTAGELEVTNAATWVEANRRIMIQASQDGDMITSATTDVASEIATDNQFRTKVIYSTDPAQFAGFAWLARVLTFDPGGVTFEYQPLRGVSAESLTSTQLGYLKSAGKNASAVIDYGGNAVTVNSVTAAGEWLDIIRDRDWFETRMQERVVVTVLTASAAGKKVPYTDKGAAIFETDVRAQLKEGITSGFLSDDIADAPTVNVPTVASMAPADRQARTFGAITFGARVAGAIHLLSINGTVSV